MLNNDNEISAILVTGGVGGEGIILNTAELFHMNGTRQCSLPSLKSPRKMHSQTGLLACGSRNDGPQGVGDGQPLDSCESFNSKTGNWSDSHTMQHSRYFHGAWKSPNGVMLLGGGRPGTSSLVTTEMVSDTPNIRSIMTTS